VVHDSNLHIEGVAATILEYLAAREVGPFEKLLYEEGGQPNRAEDIRSLKADLVGTIYLIDSNYDQTSPVRISLSQSDLEKVLAVFLGSLRYDGMVDRESRIATAHESTLHWVFQDGNTGERQTQMMKWSNLREWLESNDQLYWITGKAGSGKSTLMKFLCSPEIESTQEDRTRKHSKVPSFKERYRCHSFLKKWAGAERLVVASFYFWNSGMELQVTKDGLFRTLLHQLVAQRPEILPVVISPKHWEALCLFNQFDEHWSTHDLHSMLLKAVKALSDGSKICFFIDGLDEFGDDHEALINMVKEIIKDNEHVKMCVASRPWNIFQDALGQQSNLRLEDLTFDDIRSFVQAKFQAYKDFEDLRQRYPTFANELVDNIVKKAAGVFLWVDLVVASLLAGMRLGDRIQDFQRRLDELPPDLESLYEKILHSLEPFYLEHAAQYFALIESAEVPITLLQFSFADEETPKSAIKMDLGSMSPNESHARVEAVNRRLNSRCKGLLETNRGLHSIQGIDTRRPEVLTVQYLHRTVRDFIKSPKAQEFLKSSLNPDFDPATQLCLAYLMDLKMWQGGQESDHILDQDPNEGPRISNFFHCVKIAAGVHKKNEGALVELLDELKSVVRRPAFRYALAKSFEARDRRTDLQTYLRGRFQMQFRGRESTTQENRIVDDSFLSLTVVHNVTAYVKARAEWGGLIHPPASMNPEDQWPLLMDAISASVPEPEMVKCLLDLGADPNFRMSKVGSQSPWIVALTKVTLLYTIQSEIESSEEYLLAEEKWKQTLKLMYSHGANCAKIPASRLSSISRQVLQEITGGTQFKPQGEEGWLQSWTSSLGSLLDRTERPKSEANGPANRETVALPPETLL